MILMMVDRDAVCIVEVVDVGDSCVVDSRGEGDVDESCHCDRR